MRPDPSTFYQPPQPYGARPPLPPLPLPPLPVYPWPPPPGMAGPVGYGPPLPPRRPPLSLRAILIVAALVVGAISLAIGIPLVAKWRSDARREAREASMYKVSVQWELTDAPASRQNVIRRKMTDDLRGRLNERNMAIRDGQPIVVQVSARRIGACNMEMEVERGAGGLRVGEVVTAEGDLIDVRMRWLDPQGQVFFEQSRSVNHLPTQLHFRSRRNVDDALKASQWDRVAEMFATLPIPPLDEVRRQAGDAPDESLTAEDVGTRR